MLSRTPDDTTLQRLPKAELHVHLDGSLRAATLAELAEERDRPLPVHEERALGSHMLVSDARNLEDYLARFALTLSVLQDTEALERVAYELAEDHAAESVRWLEVRFCPALHTEEGLDGNEVLAAVAAGLKRAEEAFDLQARIIVCGLRTLDPRVSLEMAELAAAWADRGVCAFDLAGAEKGFPARDHRAAFRRAEEAGLGITVHAGEGYGAPSLRQAVEDAHAQRLGHGTRLAEDPELMERVRREGITLEICLTSNVQTRVAPSYAEHPMKDYLEAGLRLTLCTDNRLMSGVSLTDEYLHARDEQGLTGEQLAAVAGMGFESAFCGDQERAALLERFDAEVSRL